MHLSVAWAELQSAVLMWVGRRRCRKVAIYHVPRQLAPPPAVDRYADEPRTEPRGQIGPHCPPVASWQWLARGHVCWESRPRLGRLPAQSEPPWDSHTDCPRCGPLVLFISGRHSTEPVPAIGLDLRIVVASLEATTNKFRYNSANLNNTNSQEKLVA